MSEYPNSRATTPISRQRSTRHFPTIVKGQLSLDIPLGVHLDDGEGVDAVESNLTPEHQAEPVVTYPETLRDLQQALLSRATGALALSDTVSHREASPYEDLGGGLSGSASEQKTELLRRRMDALVRTHQSIPGDDIQEGIEKFGLYHLVTDDLDTMSRDHKELFWRYFEPYYDTLRFRPRSILNNHGDNPHPTFLKYEDVLKDEQVRDAYVNDVVTFRNILRDAGLSSRLEGVINPTHLDGISRRYNRDQLLRRAQERKKFLDKDTKLNGVFQVAYTLGPRVKKQFIVTRRGN